MMASIYGFIPTPEWEQEQQRRLFNYLKAKIEAEHLNPAHDYDNERTIALLKEICVADLNFRLREQLLRILDIDKKDDDE